MDENHHGHDSNENGVSDSGISSNNLLQHFKNQKLSPLLGQNMQSLLTNHKEDPIAYSAINKKENAEQSDEFQ